MIALNSKSSYYQFLTLTHIYPPVTTYTIFSFATAMSVTDRLEMLSHCSSSPERRHVGYLVKLGFALKVCVRKTLLRFDSVLWCPACLLLQSTTATPEPRAFHLAPKTFTEFEVKKNACCACLKTRFETRRPTTPRVFFNG